MTLHDTDTTPAPSVVQIELTNACNQSCLHCYSDAGVARPRELTTDEIARILVELKEMGVQSVALTGGEPLLRSDLLSLCCLANQLGLRTSVNTNGSLVTRAWLREFADIGGGLVSVSLHGIREATHDTLCGVGSFSAVIRSLEALVACNVPFGVNLTICSSNIGEVTSVHRFAASLGARQISLFRFLSVGRGQRSAAGLEIDNVTHARVLRELLPIATAEGARLHVEAPFVTDWLLHDESVDIHTCQAGRALCIITSDGEVLACTGLRGPECSAGNVRRTKLKDIWQCSAFLRTLRAFEASSSENTRACRGCDRLRLCGCGCRAAAVCGSGVINGFDPFCYLSREAE